MTEQDKPKVSKAQQKSVNKYVKNHYDRINVTLPKGKKEEIKSAAEEVNETVNGYIKVAIDERIERQKGIISTESQGATISNTSDTTSNDGATAIDSTDQIGNIAMQDRKKKATNEERSPFETNEF